MHQLCTPSSAAVGPAPVRRRAAGAAKFMSIARGGVGQGDLFAKP